MATSYFARIIKFLTIMVVAIAMAACATATGPKFSGVEPSAADQGDVYLYRTSALFAVGQAFSVFLDGKQITDLPNASYIRVRLSPGNYRLKVSPGPLTKTSELAVKVEPGKTNFYQYDFVSNPLANVFFLGSAIEPREPAKALADLKELQASKAP